MYGNDNSLEKFPGSSPETKAERSVPPEQDFAEKMKDVSPFQPEKMFGTANSENQFYGESATEEQETTDHNEGLSDAAAIINYGLDAVAREKGVEATVQGIKSFDASNTDNPVRDLYVHLGVDTMEELKDTRDESEASKHARENFRNEYNMPKTQAKTREGAIKAILDMKELIAEVEDADPRYQELRNKARAAGKGYFEYAVKDFGLRGLTDLFGVLAEQHQDKEQAETEQKTPEQDNLAQDNLEQYEFQSEMPNQEDSKQEAPNQEDSKQEAPNQEFFEPEKPEQKEVVEPTEILIEHQDDQEKDPSINSGR